MKILNRITLLLNILTFITAIGGSIYLITATPKTMPYELLIYSPFTSFLIPGLILGIIVSGSNFLSVIIYFLNKKVWSVVEFFTGVILCGWIICEYLIIKEFSWLQVVYLVIGLFIMSINFKKTYACLANL